MIAPKKISKEMASLLLLLMVLVAAMGIRSMSAVEVGFKSGARVAVEVVKEPAELSLGLMFRRSLAEDRGMLLAYGFDGHHAIWMKNMYFPLDILWLDSDLRVVNIVEDAPPCSAEPCVVYMPKKPGRYVLEVRADFVEKNEVNEGDQVVIKDTLDPSKLFR